MKEEGAFSERLAASAATAAVVARETTASELARNAALLATARGVLDVAVVDSLAAAHKAARGEAATRADAEATQARTLAARKAERADRIERERDLRRGRIATDVAVRGGVDSVDGRVHERPTSVDLPARVVMDLDLKLELEFVVSRGSVVGLSTAAAASWRRANGAEADSGVGPSSGHLPELTDISVGIVDDALDNASLMDLLQGVRQWEMPVGDAAVAGLPVAGSDLDELEGLLLSSALRATDSVGLRAVLPLCFADAAMLGADTARTAAASAVPAASSPAPLTPTSPVASSTVEPGAEISSGASARLPSLATAAISDRLGEQSSRRVLAAAIAAFSARDDADSAGDGTQVHGGTGRTAPVSADAVAPPATAQAKPAVEALRLLGDPLTQLALRLESAAARDMLGLMVAEVDAVVAAAAAPAEATRERDTLSAVSDDGPGSPRRVPSFQRTGVPSFGTTIAIVGPPHTGTAAVARVIAEALGLAVIHPASLAHRALALAGVDHRLPPKPAARVVANEPLLDTPSFDALLRRHGAALLSSIEAAGGTLASSWSAASEAPALVAALVVDAIRALAEASEPPVGWVLVDFPTSVAQARALEAAVTGFEAGGDDGSPTSRRESVASPLRAPLVDSSEVEDAVERILHGPTPALPQLSPLVVDGVDDDVERGGDASALASVGHSSSSSPTAHSRGPAAKSPSPLELSRLVAPAPLPSGRDAAASYFAVMWPTAIRSVVCLRAGLPGIVRRALGWQLDTSSVTSNTAPLEEVLHSPGAAAAALELASENEPTQSASLDAHRGGGHDAGASSSGRASTTAEGGGDAVLAVLEGAASRGMRIDGNAGAALAVSIAAGGAAGLLASSRDCPSASALSARGVTALPWPPVASTDTLSLSAVAAPAVYHLDTSPPARTFLAADACSLLLAGDAGHRPGALDGEGVAPAAVGVVETRDDRVLAISSAFREWTTVNEPALERWFSRGRTWSFVDAAVPSMMGQSGAVEGEGEGGSRITRPGALHADRHSTLLLPEIAKDALRVVRARLRALEESEAAREAALRVCEAASLHDAAEQSARLEAARRRRSGHGIAAARAVLRVLAASIAETLSVGAPSVAPPASPAAMSAAPSVRAAPAALLAAVDTSFASVAVASAAEAVARHARLGLATARLVPPPLPPAAAATPSSPLASVVRFSVVQAGGTPLASAATSSGDDSTPPATSAVGGGASRAAIAAVLSTAWHSAVAASLVESRAGVRQLREIDRRVATVLAGLRDRQEQAAGGSAAFDLPSIVDVGSGSGAGNGAEGLAAPTPLSTPGARADAAVGALAQAAREGHVEALWDTVESRERLALARVEAARIAAWQEALIREVDSAHATLVRAETRRFKAALSMLYDYAAAAEGVPLGASYGRSAVFPGAAAAEPSLVSDAVALPAPSSKGAVASKQVGGDKVGGAVKGSTAAAASASVAKGAKGAGGTHSAANAPLSVDEPHLAPIDGPSLLRAGDGALVQRMLSVILEPPEGDGSEPRADSAVVVVAAVVDAPSASSAPPPRGGSAGAKLSAPVAAKAVPAVPAPTSALSVKGAGASKAAAPAVRDAGSHALADPTPAALSALDALLALTPDASSALPALPEAHGRLQSLTAPLASVLRAVQRGLSAAFLVVAQAEALAVGQARARAVLMERERALLSSVLARQSEESAAAAAAAAEAAAGPPFVPAASVKKGSAAKPASASASATKVNNAAIIAEATSPPSFSAESSSSLPSSPASAIASVLPILDADAAAAPPPVDEGLFVAMRYEAGAYAERLVRLARHAVVAAARVRAAAAFAERDVLAAAARAALADGAAVERVSAIADSALEADDANARLVSGVGVREVGLGVGAACAS